MRNNRCGRERGLYLLFGGGCFCWFFLFLNRRLRRGRESGRRLRNLPALFHGMGCRCWLHGLWLNRGNKSRAFLCAGELNPPLNPAGRTFKRVPFRQKSFGNLICRTAGRTDNLHEHSLSRASPRCPDLAGTAGKASWQTRNVIPLPNTGGGEPCQSPHPKGMEHLFQFST